MDNYKKNKIKKCDFIIENIIIDKDKKNIYQKELEFLCLEEKNEQIELIIPFIKIITFGLIGILSKLKDLNNDKEFVLRIDARERALREQNASLEAAEEKGIEQGERNKAIEVAKNAKSIGLSCEQIIKLTGLSKEEIESL